MRYSIIFVYSHIYIFSYLLRADATKVNKNNQSASQIKEPVAIQQMIKLHLFAIAAAEAYVNRIEASLSLKLSSSSSSPQTAITASASSSQSAVPSLIYSNDAVLSTPVRSKMNKSVNGSNDCNRLMSPLQEQVAKVTFAKLLNINVTFFFMIIMFQPIL
jgi:hypothetical protein